MVVKCTWLMRVELTDANISGRKMNYSVCDQLLFESMPALLSYSNPAYASYARCFTD